MKLFVKLIVSGLFLGSLAQAQSLQPKEAETLAQALRNASSPTLGAFMQRGLGVTELTGSSLARAINGLSQSDANKVLSLLNQYVAGSAAANKPNAALANQMLANQLFKANNQVLTFAAAAKAQSLRATDVKPAAAKTEDAQLSCNADEIQKAVAGTDLSEREVIDFMKEDLLASEAACNQGFARKAANGSAQDKEVFVNSALIARCMKAAGAAAAHTKDVVVGCYAKVLGVDKATAEERAVNVQKDCAIHGRQFAAAN